MELHSTKGKESKSKLTGGCSLNAQMSVKRFVTSKSFVHDTSFVRHQTAFEIFYCDFD